MSPLQGFFVFVVMSTGSRPWLHYAAPSGLRGTEKGQVSFPRNKSRDRKGVGQHFRARRVRKTHPALTLRAR